mmetsp:Transcript_17538/g.59943  ORF Transcript_17538/g.59943 Transcript_17538/m.59943 type:complete len:261 (-) Transcript_17538:566-1348(-)
MTMIAPSSKPVSKLTAMSERKKASSMRSSTKMGPISRSPNASDRGSVTQTYTVATMTAMSHRPRNLLSGLKRTLGPPSSSWGGSIVSSMLFPKRRISSEFLRSPDPVSMGATLSTELSFTARACSSLKLAAARCASTAKSSTSSARPGGSCPGPPARPPPLALSPGSERRITSTGDAGGLPSSLPSAASLSRSTGSEDSICLWNSTRSASRRRLRASICSSSVASISSADSPTPGSTPCSRPVSRLPLYSWCDWCLRSWR